MKFHWILLCGLPLAAASACAAGIPLGTNTLVSFADVETSKQILTNRDEFVVALSPFDRAARMKTDQDVSEKDFLDFLGRNVLDWRPAETNKIAGLFQDIGRRLSHWNLPLPRSILFVKTSGREEGNASYTRQNAVILPEQEIQSADLEGTIIHELFHVLSRYNPGLRKQLYGIIHFHATDPFPFPAEFLPQKITNPDGVQLCWSIEVTREGAAVPVTPILYSSSRRYNLKKGGEFFDYLVFKFLVLTNDGGRWVPQMGAGHPQLIDPRESRGFYEQVGRNTDYVIHPDEILAANFTQLVYGRTNLPTPRIVTEMDRLLKQSPPRAE